MLYSASIAQQENSRDNRICDGRVSDARVYDARFSEVWLGKLSLRNFRNYEKADIILDDSPLVLTGSNGAGKTNLMEAVSLLAPGRGLRRAQSEQLGRQSCVSPISESTVSELAVWPSSSQEIWSVAARVETPEGPMNVGTGVLDDAASRRIVRIDGEAASQMDVAGRFAVSWLTPEMDQVLAASPSDRRRFLDRLVIAFDPAHSGRLQRYEKASRQRNRLFDEDSNDNAWFEALESEMATSGVAIIAARKALVEALHKEASLPLPAFPSAHLNLEGEAENWMDDMPAVDVEDRIKANAAIMRKRGEKIMPGASASLFVAVHSGTGQDAVMSSIGEQKALVISVVLAHARLQARRLGRPPILLLDDVVSHLDERRRESLFEIIDDLKGQVWFSGTDTGLFKTVLAKGQHIEIKNSKLKGIQPPKRNIGE